MRSTNTSMTIAEYYEQLQNRQIIINHNYQRTDRVWPVSAKSNLVDTILNGYPIPKLILSQTTDFDTRKTRKEVVDGQQRTTAIVEFYENRYALTRGAFAGRRFEELGDDAKTDFISYELSIDLFTTASDEDIREVFRRINSYQVPLNKQETRHATHQGEFKWFIVEQGKLYSTSLNKMGIVTEKQISRMADLEFITELVALLREGIKTSSPTALNKLYSENDSTFPDSQAIAEDLQYGIGMLINFPELHRGGLATRASFYSLFAALIAIHSPASKPAQSLPEGERGRDLVERDVALANLGLLSEAVEADDEGPFGAFVAASKQGTNTLKNRTTRFRWYYEALTGTLPLDE
jgi:hypothetical protein